MSWITKLDSFVAGGLGSTIVDTVKDYFPPSMSEQEKAELTQRIKEAANKQELEILKLDNQKTSMFNQRIQEMEGTAKDLKAIPVIGALMLFLRGSQRPLWGFMTMYMDYKVFSGAWTDLTEQQESALWVINLLVLTFLFGERAIKNLGPLLERLFKK